MDSALTVGTRAPDFTLPAANQPESVSLYSLLKHGAAVVEFLRGTW